MGLEVVGCAAKTPRAALGWAVSRTNPQPRCPFPDWETEAPARDALPRDLAVTIAPLPPSKVWIQSAVFGPVDSADVGT